MTAILRLLLGWVSVRFITGLGHDIDVRIFKNFLSLKYEDYLVKNSSELIAAIEKVQVAIWSNASGYTRFCVICNKLIHYPSNKS